MKIKRMAQPIPKEVPVRPDDYMSAEDLADLVGNKKPDMIRLAAFPPASRTPINDTVYVFESRITDTESVFPRTGRRANKQYIVRVYEYEDTMSPYGVIAFYGPIGGTLQMDWKGARHNRGNAISYARRIISEKVSDQSKNYLLSNFDQTGFDPDTIPGRRNIVEPRPTQAINAPPLRSQDIPGPEDIPESESEAGEEDSVYRRSKVKDFIEEIRACPSVFNVPHEFGHYTYLISAQRNFNAEHGYIVYEYHTAGDIPVVSRPYSMALRRQWFSRMSDAILQIEKWALESVSIMESPQTPEAEEDVPDSVSQQKSVPVSPELKKRLQDKGFVSEEDLAGLIGSKKNWYKKA